jgi:phage terminase large subunit
MIHMGLSNQLKSPQYAYIAPTYGQAKRVAWDLLKDYTKHIPGRTVNEADLRIDIERPAKGDRIRFMLLGAENPGTLKGLYLDGVVLDEYAEMNPQIWSEVVRPALSDRLGWGIFIGTPKGQNHFYDIYQSAKNDPKNWFTAIYKASETQIIPRTELEANRSQMSEAEYMQEFECSFAAALVGAYYGKEMEEAETTERIRDVGYDKRLPVTTYWDLGMDDSTAIWFGQVVAGGEIRWIDYHEDAGHDLEHYAKVLKDKGYSYDRAILPHDGAVRELGTGKSRQDTLRQHLRGVRVEIQPKTKPADGINAARLMLKRSWFDKTKCKDGIDALKNYERKWDAKREVFQSIPLHNWASHGADAFRLAAMAIREEGFGTKRRPRQANNEWKIV